MQKVLLYCVLFLNPPVLFISLAILDAGYNNILDYIYIFITFNFLAYIYFHFFNMSETSRRIKILIGIRKGKIRNINDIKSYYDYDRSLLIRLKRLEEMSQVRIISSDSYILQGRLLYTVSCIVFFFRIMLGFGNIKK